ncbi:response regulator transcription factor [Mucilaginibacter aquaedulcis]|uniref:response regulator transcription factor n=1 Tax=Mucilaginibacter aquaedulcis TaxID=1187081 RepID=UPI0025B55E22|nr:response regulator [Mucilaginibacter aquaedulcis]MDN3551189.1 response regulator [Mucilaginibacter aquaedulcis]
MDDDTAVLDVLKELLDYEGFEPFIVEETDDLMGLVRLCQPSLILLDYGLHGKNGGEWCAQLKSSLEFSAIPIIIYTAYCNKGIQKGTYGCDDFIAKPFDIDDMISRINLLIKPLPEHDHPVSKYQSEVEFIQKIRQL